ncbi:SURF1 family protein [Novosphingobium colocasiae]|uniref:SURF1-like protein n=1 Tax=Novosphingobium colocasiae TaxID=1256513 RepID=A0A918PKK2_9SPHN|nr:SURF1 family protein [Novosphingobium colocasiae]GGZ11877.1 hypothetical protein GCM10011614_28530 [Novosphingobium colocasiae]
MKRAIPILPTLVVLAAAAVMVRMGFWQLDRLHQKEALLARYEAAQQSDIIVNWPGSDPKWEDRLYRRTSVLCSKVVSHSSMAGENTKGEAGPAATALCDLGHGSQALVVLGWSPDPNAGKGWTGGTVTGWIAPGPRLVADPPLAGLEANARPDPADIPNNHLSYAIQWLLFALTALVIYAIALRKRRKDRP